jgi:hypothetical protein
MASSANRWRAGLFLSEDAGTRKRPIAVAAQGRAAYVLRHHRLNEKILTKLAKDGEKPGRGDLATGNVSAMMVVDHLFAMRPATLSLGLLLLLSLAAAGSQARGQLPSQAKDQEGGASAIVPIALVPHRAIYDLSLGATRSNAQVAGVRGRILYDFDGNTCQGYSLEFRQVSELDTGEGKVSTTDLRSTTWEGADAKSFKFTSQNFIDENLVDSVDGHAEREASKTAVALEKPQQKSLSLAAGVVFPTEQRRACRPERPEFSGL